MIIHLHVRPEFSEVSVARLASRPLDLFVLCLVVYQTLVFLLLRAGNGLLVIPTPHRPWLEATGLVFLLPAKYFGRSAIFLGGRPFMLGNRPYFLADPFPSIFDRYFMPTVTADSWHPHFTPSILVYGGICLLFSFSWKLKDLNLYKEGAPPPSSRFRKLVLERIDIVLYLFFLF